MSVAQSDYVGRSRFEIAASALAGRLPGEGGWLMAKLDYPAALEAAQNLRDGNLRLTTAATTRIDDLRTEVNEIVEAIEGVREMAGIWVSDKSRLLDFGCSDSQAQELRDLFGIEVDVNDHIWELAERLRQKREG